MANCNKCLQDIDNNNFVDCKFCNSSYHKRCVYGNVNDELQICFNCTGNLFPFNHILDDDEFRYSLKYFHSNSIEYNRVLSLKLNPFVFDEIINNDSAYNLINPNSGNSCNYIFDSSFGIDVSFKNGFSILHLNSRSFNRNCDSIDAFLSDIDYNFSVIAISETSFNEDHSNLVDIPNYSISNPHANRSGGSALYIHNFISYKLRPHFNLILHSTNAFDHSESVFVEIVNSNS